MVEVMGRVSGGYSVEQVNEKCGGVDGINWHGSDSGG